MQLRVLIVEDNLDWEEIWKVIFGVFSDKSEIIWATSVCEAKKRLNQFTSDGLRFDIIVSDIFLSGSFTGFDLFNCLDEQYQQRFLFVSSVESGKVREWLRKPSDEIHVLQKPFGMKEAIGALRGILRNNHCHSDSSLEAIHS